MTTASSPPRRRWLPLRFSLRVLLLAVTAFAIGFPVWYRWPYEEVHPAVASHPDGVMVATTWRRQWGSGRLEHGPQRAYLHDWLLRVETFRDGVLHGPCEYSWEGREIGQYSQGAKDGLWSLVNSKGHVVRTAAWRNGCLDGPYNALFPDGKRLRLLFIGGRVVQVDGHPAGDHASELIAAKMIDSPQVIAALQSETDLDFVERPLDDIASYLAIGHGIPIVVDPYQANKELRVYGDWKGMQLGSMLAIMTSHYGLACDYRYGLLWITSAEDAKDWHDPTGVAKIRPAQESQLASSWNEMTDIEAIGVPLADALKKLAQSLAIGVDVSAIEPTDSATEQYVVIEYLRGIPFRHALGILLYQTRCRCKLDGETLVILPPRPDGE